MIAINARKVCFFAEYSFDPGATDFSTESATLTESLSTSASPIFGVSFAFRQSSAKHFAPMFFSVFFRSVWDINRDFFLKSDKNMSVRDTSRYNFWLINSRIRRATFLPKEFRLTFSLIGISAETA